MANFMLLVFLLTGSDFLAHACELHEAKYHFDTCILRWKYGRYGNQKPFAFMRDITVTKEICWKGAIHKMQRCMSKNIPAECNNAHRYWRAQESKFTYICSHYREFQDVHRGCRTNDHVANGLEKCFYEKDQRQYQEGFCLSSKYFFECSRDAFSRHCTDEATGFFLEIFYKEFFPDMEHQHCFTDDVEAIVYADMPNIDADRLDEDSPRWSGNKQTRENVNVIRADTNKGAHCRAIKLYVMVCSVLHLWVSWFW